ncbi:MAG: class I SAM-dependent methyltransferase [Acidobacteriota bacterium]
MDAFDASERGEKIASDHLGAVEETLMIPLRGRAVEQRRRRPLLRDPKAEAIVAAIDYDFEKFDGPSLRGATWRTRLYDRLVRRWMDDHPGATVVELGCGLNTRFERVDDGRVRWRDLDVPDVIAIWRRFFEETERRRAIASSAFEEGWMDALAEEVDGPVLFVSEASTLYFSADQNRDLYRSLGARFPGSQAIFDTANGAFVANQDRHDALRHCTARVSWAVEDRDELAAWGLEVLERFPLVRPPLWLRREAPLYYRGLSWLMAVLRSALLDTYQINRVRLGSSPA